MSVLASRKAYETDVRPKSVGSLAINEMQVPLVWDWFWDDDRTITYAVQKDGFIFENIIERRPIEEAAVADIDAGVLSIDPTMGHDITLTGHGAADFTITGFGTLCPRGYEFSLYIPRTIGAGVANSLGHYVDFDHAAAGEGLDLTITRYQNGITSVYGYTAYPDACEAAGYPAALYEKLTFLHEGEGRWRLTRLPDPATGTNANGNWEKKSDGTMTCWHSYTCSALSISNNNIGTYGWSYYIGADAVTFPAGFIALPVAVPSGNTITTSNLVSASIDSLTTTGCRLVTYDNGATGVPVGYVAIGRWK
jgi:hypothetical protein